MRQYIHIGTAQDWSNNMTLGFEKVIGSYPKLLIASLIIKCSDAIE